MNASFSYVYSSFWSLIPFSPRQVGFRPGRSTLDQILFLAQSISDAFNKRRPDSRTILYTIDFSKAFDSVWHPTLFHKLISAGLSPCFANWTQSFVIQLNHALAWFIRIRKVVSFESIEVFHKDPFLVLYFFNNDLPASLPSSVSCSLHADDLAIWSSSPSFFSVDPHQANIQPNLFLLNSRLRFNPTPTFLGVTFDHTLSFSKHVSSLKAKFFLVSRPYTVSLLPHGVPLKSPSLFCIKISSAPSHICFPRMVSFLKCYQYHLIGTPSPSC